MNVFLYFADMTVSDHLYIIPDIISNSSGLSYQYVNGIMHHEFWPHGQKVKAITKKAKDYPKKRV